MSKQDRRIAFLHEMGLGPVWSQHGAESVVPEAVAPLVILPAVSTQSVPPRVAEQVVSAWGDEQLSMPASAPAPIAVSAETIDIASLTALVKPANELVNMGWDQLKSLVADCRQCGLCKGRTQTVFGVGDQKARWLFVGEGPGRNEDFQGEPFVGPAGKLLDNMFKAMGLQRGENAYIANVVKCRPTDENKRDRAPAAEEIEACMPYLQRQIALINPTVIVALGKTAALSLLKLDPATPVSKLRGTVHRYEGRPLIVTYHPAYLLRTLKDKSKAWADLCLAMQTYADQANG